MADAAPTLADVLKEIKKVSGKDALMEGIKVVDIPRVKCPAAQLNLAFTGGGCPRGRILELFGPEGGGKSTCALLIGAGFQQADERPIFWVDAEGTYDPFWAAKLGIDNKRVIKWCPDSSTAEEVFQKCLDIVETGGVSYVAIDSIPALVPQNVEAKDMDQLTMAGISAPLSRFSQKMTKALLRHPDVTVVGLNQLRDNLSQYGDPYSTPGGHAWKHFCSVRMQVRSEQIDDAGTVLPDKSETATGVKINVFLRKNKTGPRDWKNTSFNVSFLTGFNPKLDLLETGKMLGIIETHGSSVQMLRKDTGELVKAVGKRGFLEILEGDTMKYLEEAILANSKIAIQ